MKKIFVLFLLMFIIPSVFALEESEVKPLETNTGAEIRFMQLERSIYLNEIKAERVLEFINQKEEQEYSLLKSLILELGILRSEISSLDFTSLNKEETIKKYVDYRRAANLASKEFRQEALKHLSESEISILSNPSRMEEDRQKIQEYNQMIVLKIREHNAKTFEEKSKDIIEDNSKQEILRNIRTGDLSTAQTRNILVQKIQDKPQEERRQLILIKQEELEQEKASREKILREREDSFAVNLREQAIERAEQIRSNTKVGINTPYRLVVVVGETVGVENQRFNLQRLSEKQAFIVYAGQEFILNIRERQNLRHATVMYYAFRSETEGLFVISPNIVFSSDQLEISERPEQRESLVREPVEEQRIPQRIQEDETTPLDREVRSNILEREDMGDRR